ncbi:MAG: DMT family transporter [Pseudomonadota bacterium]
MLVRGVILMLLASGCFAVMNTLVALGGKTLPAIELVFLRNVFGLVVCLPLLPRVLPAILRSSNHGLYLLRALVSFSAMLIWFWSLNQLPLAEAVSLSFTLPLFVIAGAALFLGEAVGPRRWVATAVGFVGVLVILRPGFIPVSLASVAVVFSTALMAAAVLMVKNLSNTEAPLVIVLYLLLIMLPVSGVASIPVWVTPSPKVWLLMAGLGVFATVAQWLFTTAMRGRDVSILAPLDFFRLPFTALLAYWIFDQLPSFWTWLGAGIIVAANLYIVRREAKLARERQQSPPAPAGAEPGSC